MKATTIGQRPGDCLSTKTRRGIFAANSMTCDWLTASCIVAAVALRPTLRVWLERFRKSSALVGRFKIDTDEAAVGQMLGWVALGVVVNDAEHPHYSTPYPSQKVATTITQCLAIVKLAGCRDQR